MARQTPLPQIRAMLKGELGSNLTAGVATAQDPELNSLLSNAQKWFSSEWDWPFLQCRWDVQVTPGSRYLTLPTVDNQALTHAINFERPVVVQTKFNLRWLDTEYEIGSEQFNYIDSDRNQQQDPIQRWQWSGETQFEIWPINTTTQTVRFTGQRVLGALTSETDTADLDDMLLVYTVAAQLLARRKHGDAALKQQLAQERLSKVRSVYPIKNNVTRFGHKPTSIRRVVPIITVH